MLDNFRFYFKHSVNDLRVNGQRTFFALLCIAAGVAAIVSLQTLAVMIQSSLTGGLQESNRGDIQIQPSMSMMQGGEDALAQAADAGLLDAEAMSFFGQTQTTYRVSLAGVEAIQAWLDENYPDQAEMTYRQPLTNQLDVFLGGGKGTSIVNLANGLEASQMIPLLIDPQVFPYYGQIVSVDGTPMAQMITAPTDVVLSEQVAQPLQVNVGDTVKIAGSDADFTVRGIVEASQEVKNPGTDVFLSLFGFYYLEQQATELFEDVTPQAETIFVKLSDPSRVAEINSALVRQFPFLTTTTTDDLRENYTELSENINQLVTVMGLLSMLIGSVGIINTMQVIVRRRTVEVAVLKTLGLQANEITILFLVEAVVMGVLGSLFGIVLGWALTFAIRGVAERLLATDLPFVLTAQPALTGLLVGVVVTAVFGFLPTLTAGQVRPGVVLRPTDAVLPRAGRLRSLFALAVIILVLSLIAQSILGSFSTALQVVLGVFIAAGILYGVLSVLIWLVGRFFPSFGLVDLKISLRQMLAGRARAAMTLLALVVGVFSLSTITLMADSINNLLQFSLEEASGGNVTITVGFPSQLPSIQQALDETPGVESYRVQRSYSMDLLSVQDGDVTLTPDDLRQRLESVRENVMMGPDGGDGEQVDLFAILSNSVGNVGAVDVNGKIPDNALQEGRQLTPDDAGKPVMVVDGSRFTEAAGISVGDRLTFQINASSNPLLGGGSTGDGPQVTFEVVGVTSQTGIGGFETQNYAPQDSFPEGVEPTATTIVAKVDKEQIPALRKALSSQLGVFVIDNAAITRLISSLLATFTAFPTMVAALGLIVGGVVIANSVALTTMERRREIAVMKSVGLQRERVLFMILLENGILGLIGGLIGVGIGLVALVALLGVTGAPGSAIPVGAALGLMMLCVLVALIAAVSTAWGASGEKPLNVLRYE